MGYINGYLKNRQILLKTITLRIFEESWKTGTELGN